MPQKLTAVGLQSALASYLECVEDINEKQRQITNAESQIRTNQNAMERLRADFKETMGPENEPINVLMPDKSLMRIEWIKESAKVWITKQKLIVNGKLEIN